MNPVEMEEISMKKKKRKKNQQQDGHDDRISCLPESLIHHILSFLRIYDVIPTSFLSRRWRHLWRTTPVLDFGVRRWYSYKAPSIIGTALMLYEGRKVRRLSFEVGHVSESHLDSWIRFATRRDVEDLDLIFGNPGEGGDMYEMPRYLLECEALRVLKLQFCDLNLLQSLHFHLLTELRLEFVAITKLDVSGCPLLECLVMDRCRNCIKIHAPNKKLRYLEITDYDNYHDLTVYAPNLPSVRLIGHFKMVYKLENLSSIESASLEHRYPDYRAPNSIQPELQNLMELLKSLSNAKTLKLSQSAIEVVNMSMEGSHSQSQSQNQKEVISEDVIVVEEGDSNLEKRRKLTSKVWTEFTRFKGPKGDYLAKCNHCKREFVGESCKGTTHLRNHLSRCVLRGHKDIGQQLLTAAKNVGDGTFKLKIYKFDQESSRMDLARMIIKHKYPFNMAEHEFFEIFCNGLNPNFKLVSRNTIRAYVLVVHQEEKQKLYAFLEDLPCKITLTTDIWTSDHQNFAYACLTAHFINDAWELNKNIIAYRYIEYPHDGETLFRFISDLILEWNIDKKLCAMMVDNASANDSMNRHLKRWLCDKSLLSSSGDLFHVRCSAHILNLIVQDGLKEIGGLLNKIRDSVRYLSSSPYGKQKFDNAVNQVKLRGKKKVPMDVPTRWNSTYSMLEAALGLKDAFSRLEQIDRNYKHNPSEDEWKIAGVVGECLKIFYDATCHFSGTNFPTANIFFPNICEIHLKLNEWLICDEICLRSMAVPMKEKFEKYWEECSLLLAIVVVLDPRFKIAIVEYYYTMLYGVNSSKYVQRVRNALVDLYNEYRLTSSMSVDCFGGSGINDR